MVLIYLFKDSRLMAWKQKNWANNQISGSFHYFLEKIRQGLITFIQKMKEDS